jgi:DNA-binding NarL/FixJ family response regulator
LIRVCIDTASAVTRAGLESLLDASGALELVGSVADADVVLCDEFPEDHERAIPSVVLSDAPFTPRLLSRGVHAVLALEAPLDQIVAALCAAAAGLVALPADVFPRVIPESDAEPAEALTPRETETLEMVAEGLSNKQIAARLNISDHTAKFHVNSILNKLGAGTRTEAVMRGIRRGWIKV